MSTHSHISVSLNIELVVAPEPRQTQLFVLKLQQGATLADVLASVANDLGSFHPAIQEGLQNGSYIPSIWGKLKSHETLLKEGDRVELTRGLKVDPKEARRQRYQKQSQSDSNRRKTRPLSKNIQATT